MQNILKCSLVALAVGGGVIVSGAALADPVTLGVAGTGEGKTVVICKGAIAQPVVAAGCGVVVLVLNEVLIAKHPFGPDGEIMKVLMSPPKIIDGNIKGAERESGEAAKVLRGALGISIRDIEAYGISGGPNSVLRKPFGTIFGG